MEKDNYITEVVFRKDKDGTVFALLPYGIASGYSVTSYQHVGQHSSADYDHCIRTTKKATEEEYKDLKSEMESVGYDLKVISRRHYVKFLHAYYKSVKN